MLQCLFISVFSLKIQSSKGVKIPLNGLTPPHALSVPILVLYFKRYISLSLLVKQFEARGGCSFGEIADHHCLNLIKLRYRTQDIRLRPV